MPLRGFVKTNMSIILARGRLLLTVACDMVKGEARLEGWEREER